MANRRQLTLMMASPAHHDSPLSSRLFVACGALALMLSLSTGCAHSPGAAKKQQDELGAMQARLDEVERTNGRLTVRVEELEDQLFLLNDRVEAHRLALQRRGFMRDNQAIAMAPRAPSPAPETYYVEGQGDETVQTPRPQRQVTRIPLGAKAQPEAASPRAATKPEPKPREAEPQIEDVVYTEEQYRELVGEFEEAPRRQSPSNNAAPTSYGRQAQAPVTSERLNAAKKNEPSSEPVAAKEEILERRFSPEQPSTTAPKAGLAAYRDALAQYRAGNYQEALTGFESFLAAGPKEDYVDNALYWIGECHYGLGHYAQAIAQFERVIKEQSDGNKVPDAMLKMSLAIERVGQRERAVKVLNQLIERYPLTNAASLGKKRLSELGEAAP